MQLILGSNLGTEVDGTHAGRGEFSLSNKRRSHPYYCAFEEVSYKTKVNKEPRIIINHNAQLNVMYNFTLLLIKELL
jgi:hypothetical protein